MTMMKPTRLLWARPLRPFGIHAFVTRHQYRRLHDSRPHREASTAAFETQRLASDSITSTQPSETACKAPLSLLPSSTLIRSYLITYLSSTPLLLTPALKLLSILAHSQSPVLSPDRNPVLRYLLKKTFYAQFCAGETEAEVRRTVLGLKGMGYRGVILGYAREVCLGEGEVGALGEKMGASGVDMEMEAWKKGTLETVRLAEEDDFVALKFTGAGRQALSQLSKSLPPDEGLEASIIEICELAKARNVRLLFDAEQHALQKGIDAWTMAFQRRYNSRISSKAVVYGTYQAYLRSTPANLAGHLAVAKAEGFTLGVKLVRGAYLGCDPRHLFWGQKEETDRAYDGIAEAMMRRTYNDTLTPPNGTSKKDFPEVNLVLASHNQETVRKAMSVRTEQIERGDERIDMIYGQLMGMADEVSCELVMAGKDEKALEINGNLAPEVPKAYKYLVWGTVGECVKYLLRRAEENRDAVARTKEGCVALRAELDRRFLGS